MSYEEMRAMIRDVYCTDTWHDRVDCMSNEQVVAVYLKFKKQGKFDTYSEEKPKESKKCMPGRLTPEFKSESLIDLDKRIDRLIDTLKEFCIILTPAEQAHMREMATYEEAYAYYQKMIRERL